jgi:LacI family transcriptional regulator
MPTVVLGWDAQDFATSSVVADHRGGARTLVEMLLEVGHRRIGLLQDLDACSSSRDGALAAYTNALATYDLEVGPELLGAADLAGTVAAAVALLSVPDPPTALCCGTDVVAVGVYQAAERLGLGVPRDLSVVAFADTLGLGVALQPGLTAVALPYREMGCRAVANLLDQVVRVEPASVVQQVLATTLLRRGSTAPPNPAGRRRRQAPLSAA